MCTVDTEDLFLVLQTIAVCVCLSVCLSILFAWSIWLNLHEVSTEYKGQGSKKKGLVQEEGCLKSETACRATETREVAVRTSELRDTQSTGTLVGLMLRDRLCCMDRAS